MDVKSLVIVPQFLDILFLSFGFFFHGFFLFALQFAEFLLVYLQAPGVFPWPCSLLMNPSKALFFTLL